MVLVFLVLSHHLCHWILPCFPPSGGVSTWDTVRQVSLRARGKKHKGSVSSMQCAAGACTHAHAHAHTHRGRLVWLSLLDELCLMCFTKTWHSDAAAGPPACDGGEWKLGSDSTHCHVVGEKYKVCVTVGAGRDSRRALEAVSSDFLSAGERLQHTHNRLLTGPPSNC